MANEAPTWSITWVWQVNWIKHMISRAALVWRMVT